MDAAMLWLKSRVEKITVKSQEQMSLSSSFYFFWLLLRHGKFKVNEKFEGELLQNSIRKWMEIS
jgi:hypothetical protein